MATGKTPTRDVVEWIPICPGCLHENQPTAPFCGVCGMPIGSIATIDPIQQIYATGWIYRRAIAGGRWPLAFWGMLLIFAPSVLPWLVILISMPFQTGVVVVDRLESLMALVVGLAFPVLSVAILVRVVRGYVRHRRTTSGMCRRCGYNLSHLVEPRCPECGTKFDPDDIQDATGDCEEEIETPSDSFDPSAKEFPVDCEACGAPLTGEAYTGECPSCGAAFIRRDRVVDTYGPEAFLPDQPKRARATGGKSRYRRAMILTAVSVASIPLAYVLVDRGLVQSDRLPFLLFLFVGVVFEWVRVWQTESESDEDDGSPPDMS
ncbi:MAG: hypothetical protein IIC02_12155 [Planctomycetes bacterium]|nr:hypothetical protein [Planctomycetota bacterium]